MTICKNMKITQQLAQTGTEAGDTPDTSDQ